MDSAAIQPRFLRHARFETQVEARIAAFEFIEGFLRIYYFLDVVILVVHCSREGKMQGLEPLEAPRATNVGSGRTTPQINAALGKNFGLAFLRYGSS